MRTIFFLCSLAASTAIAAQKFFVAPVPATGIAKARPGSATPPKKPAPAANFYRSIPDTIMPGDTVPIDRMPNAITTKPLPPIFKRNNGRGFDVYESTVDGMPILMPDSANKASLNYSPVKRTPGMLRGRLYIVPGKEYRKPR